MNDNGRYVLSLMCLLVYTRATIIQKATGNILNSDSRVVVFGAINMDLLATASVALVSDDSTPGRLRRSAGGVGRNIAENLGRLGLTTTLVSAVGDDSFGIQLLKELQQVGVDVSNVVVQADEATASYTAIHHTDGELLHAISDMRLFDSFQLSESYGYAKGAVEQIIETADAVVIDANLPEATLQMIANHCRKTLLYADGVSRSKCLNLKCVLEALTLLKVNRAEAIALTGCRSSDDEALLVALHKLGPSKILLTSGEKGAVLFENGVMHQSLALTETEVISTSGAGDAMLSGVIAAELAGYSATESLQRGIKAAVETLRVYSACSNKLSRSLLQL